MSEPLDEEAEVSWLTYLNRFEQEIYPTLFAQRGYTKAEALLVWSLHGIESSIDTLAARIEDRL